MQNTRLLSGAEVEINTTNFPAVLMAIREPNVVAGDGVSAGLPGTGSLTDPISGAVFVPSGPVQGVFKPGPAGTFGARNASGAEWALASGAMPTIGMKHPLMIVVRHAAGAVAAAWGLGDFAGTGPSLAVGNGGNIAANYSGNVGVLSGAITFGAAGIAAYAAFLDRTKATDILGGQFIIAEPTANKVIAATTDADATAGNLLAASFPALTTGMVPFGVATSINNNVYGIYLLAFNSPGALQTAWLSAALQWMARNPTKGLYPLFAGLT